MGGRHRSSRAETPGDHVAPQAVWERTHEVHLVLRAHEARFEGEHEVGVEIADAVFTLPRHLGQRAPEIDVETHPVGRFITGRGEQVGHPRRTGMLAQPHLVGPLVQLGPVVGDGPQHPRTGRPQMPPGAQMHTEPRQIGLEEGDVDILVRTAHSGERLQGHSPSDPPGPAEAAQQVGALGQRQRLPRPVPPLEVRVVHDPHGTGRGTRAALVVRAPSPRPVAYTWYAASSPSACSCTLARTRVPASVCRTSSTSPCSCRRESRSPRS